MDASYKEPLATVSYVWTKKYYNQYSSIMGVKMTTWIVAFNLIMGLLLILAGTIDSVIIGIFVSGISIYYGGNFAASAIFKSYKMLHELKVQLDFYESYVVISDKYSLTKLPYEVFNSVKSSKYGYVLYNSKISGLFIPKDVCSEQLVKLMEQINNYNKN